MPHNILIVDDSATTRAMIKRIIKMCGFDTAAVREAADGQLALDALRVAPTDLVLADLHMPNVGGIELTRQIMADPDLRRTPVVIVSADPNAGRAEELTALGVKGYLQKPFTPEAFRDVLGRVLGATSHAA